MAGLGEVAGGFQVVGVMLVAGGLVLVQDPKKAVALVCPLRQQISTKSKSNKNKTSQDRTPIG